MKGFLKSFLTMPADDGAVLRDEEHDDAPACIQEAEKASEPPPSHWDPIEAGRLLEQLRADSAVIERTHYRGQFPPHVARLAADSETIAERYMRDQELMAARGWDPLQLLRDLVRTNPEILRGDRLKPRQCREVRGPGTT